MTHLINRLFRWVGFPLYFQLLTLSGFILLIVIGFSANTADMAFAKVLRNTNLANLIVWSYWWPMIILSAMFLGRVWCTVCPIELITSLASKFGLKRKPPALFRSGWLIAVFYVLTLFIGIHILAIHRVPFRMAIYMASLFGLALVIGFTFSRNTFCASICPVGHLLGLYARLAPLGWGVRDNSVCSSCKDQSCVSKKNAYTFQGRSCGVGLRPANIDDNSDCLLCGQCLKACSQNNPGLDARPNPGWFPRPWFKDILNLKPLTNPQAAFALIVSGFVVYEVFTEWVVTKNWLLFIPLTLEQTLGISGAIGLGLLKSITLFIALPTLLWIIPFIAFRLAGGKLPLNDYLLRFGVAFIPIMAAAHAIKAVLKMTSRIPHWDHALSDPIGVKTAHAVLDQSLSLSSLPSWRDPLITALSLALISGAIALSLLVIRKLITAHCPHSGWRSLPLYLIPTLYGGAFFIMLVAWRI